jgi:hypothetical protein
MSTIERTTVRLPSELLRRVERKAAQKGVTLTALIEEGLRHQLSSSSESGADVPPLPISSARGRCLVDLSSYAKVADMLDEELPFEKLR